MSIEVTVTTQPAMTVATYRRSTTHTEIFTAIPTGLEKVMGYIAGSGLEPTGVPFTLYYQAPDADTEGEIAMCIPVAAVADAADGVEVIEMPPAVAATVVHRGSYDNMGESYAAAAGWIHEHGHQIVGPPREVYLNSPFEVAEAELLTELHFPIDGDEGI